MGPSQADGPFASIEDDRKALVEPLLDLRVLHRRQLLQDLQCFGRWDGEDLLEHVEVGGDLVRNESDRHAERVCPPNLNSLSVSSRKVGQVCDRDNPTHGLTDVSDAEAE